MKLTPILGLEYAEGPDPAKQYPTAVDKPSKVKIEAAIDARALKTELAAPEHVIPPGVVLGYTAPTPPAGWLLCDGAAVSRTTYAALFAIIGTTYGIGDGSTTFNLPDSRGRASAGFDSTQTEFNTLGKKSGAKTHTHEHVYPVGKSSANVATHEPGSARLEWRDSRVRLVDSQASNVGGTTPIAAVPYDRFVVTSTSDSSLQPYITLHHIIKT
jgi:microcystin-dependent protein